MIIISALITEFQDYYRNKTEKYIKHLKSKIEE